MGLFVVLFFLLTNAMVSGELNDNKTLFPFVGMAIGLRERADDEA